MGSNLVVCLECLRSHSCSCFKCQVDGTTLGWVIEHSPYLVESITVQLVYCLTGLDLTKQEIMLLFVSDKAPIKLESSYTEILPPAMSVLLEGKTNILRLEHEHLYSKVG